MIRGYLVSSLTRDRFLRCDSVGTTWDTIEYATVFGTEERARAAASKRTREKIRTRVILALEVGVALHAPVEAGDKVPDVPKWVERPKGFV